MQQSSAEAGKSDQSAPSSRFLTNTLVNLVSLSLERSERRRNGPTKTGTKIRGAGGEERLTGQKKRLGTRRRQATLPDARKRWWFHH